jgi:hypothetical protein
MEMLRSFVNNPDVYLIKDVLNCFDIKDTKFSMLRFEVISPDSFMWRLLIGDRIYYLYAEDFIPSLEHVRHILDTYLNSGDWSLVKCKIPTDFTSSSPVKGAAVYKEPDDVSEIMKYAVDSGHDFVFLALSKEYHTNALFSKSSPRGFSNK